MNSSMAGIWTSIRLVLMDDISGFAMRLPSTAYNLPFTVHSITFSMSTKYGFAITKSRLRMQRM